jgi:hypothetical protein
MCQTPLESEGRRRFPLLPPVVQSYLLLRRTRSVVRMREAQLRAPAHINNETHPNLTMTCKGLLVEFWWILLCAA